MKKLIATLVLCVLVCCSGLVSANPYYAHDEPQEEQWSDFLRSNPLILPLMAVMFALVAGGIFLWWLSRSESKSEANP